MRRGRRVSKLGGVVFLSIVFVLLCYRSIGAEASSWLDDQEQQIAFEQQHSEMFGRAVLPMAIAGQAQQATFAAGCFWSVELAYQRVPGVTKTAVGYTQGHVANPTYQQVTTGRTGHAEAVRVEYNPIEVSYQQLLDVFWKKHDPTQKNRQGNDVGTQYRSGIYYHTPEQGSIAKASLQEIEKKLGRKVATELLPATDFYVAEDYHQQYLERGLGGRGKQSARKNCNDPIRCYG